MAYFALFALIIWLPIVFVLFEKYPVQKAIIYSFVAGWLFLPPTIIILPGVPDWSKSSATAVSVFLCCWLKHAPQMLAVRLKWYDLPALVYCTCPFLASVMNGLGVYDGLSAVLEESVRWGMPYLIGRAYLTDSKGIRLFCLSIAIGGLIYIPFCLYEIRMSPMLKTMIYGFRTPTDVEIGYRYGGYRPMVFLVSGLEVGWWMCCSWLAALMLWRSGAVQRIRGYPMVVVTIALGLMALACKATGAILQIFLGVFLIYFSNRMKRDWLVWLVMLIPPTYCVVRATNLWNPINFTSSLVGVFGEDRIQSVNYRFVQEDLLTASANQRFLYGWGRTGGFNPPDSSGKIAVTDGLWILIYGWAGGLGLGSLNLMHLVPTAVFLRRFKPETWFDPDVAPVTTLAMILPLFMIDNLSNAMLNPIYAVAMGAVAAHYPDRNGRGTEQGRRRDHRSMTAPTHQTMPAASRHALRREAALDREADELEADAIAADQEDRYEDAYELFQHSIQSRHTALRLHETPTRLDRLALTHVLHARFLTRIDQIPAAIVERDRALSLWRMIESSHARADFTLDAHAANLNDLAWLLIADQVEPGSDGLRAILLAEEAVAILPGHASFWNTLGIARYRQRDHYKALHALSRAVSLSDDGGNAFDFYFLALTNHALGYPRPAADWFERGEVWASRRPELGPMLSRIRDEATDALGTTRMA